MNPCNNRRNSFPVLTKDLRVGQQIVETRSGQGDEIATDECSEGTLSGCFPDFAMDLLLPTDNAYDIPLLDRAIQPDFIPLPILPWGAKSRTKPLNGTYHFYIDDRKFEPLWSDPAKFLKVAPECAIEVNFTINADTPKAIALYQIFRKRTLSHVFQKAGIPLLVDLNVPDSHLDLALLGVPQGWSGYATRGFLGAESDLERRYELAQTHSQLENPYFLVYAGGDKIKAHCKKHGWVYVETYRGG